MSLGGLVVAVALVLAPVRTAHAENEAKSPVAAGALSVGGTLAGLATIFAGLATERDELVLVGAGIEMVAPAAGHVYAGELEHALFTSAVRVGATTLLVLGAQNMFGCEDFCDDDEKTEAGAIALLAGGVILIGITGYDLIDAPEAARRANERTRIFVSPVVVPGADGPAPGAAIGGTF